MPNIRPLTNELSRIAREELNEVPEHISDQISALRAWISTQPHLLAEFDDQFLVTFLRGCKYNLDLTKKKINYNFTIMTMMADIIIDRDPTDPILLEIIRLGIFTVMPFPDKPEGPMVILIRPRVYQPAQFEMSKLIKVYTMITSLLQRDNDNFAISGQIVFYDLTNVGWSQLLELEPSHVRNIISIVQEAMPARLNGVHIYKPPKTFKTFHKITKAFLNAENKKKVKVHGNKIESVYRFVPQRVLPTEYGGDAGPIQDIIDDWEKKLVANRDYFKDLDKIAPEKMDKRS